MKYFKKYKTCLRLTLQTGLVCTATFISVSSLANDDLKDIAIKFKDATSFYLLAQKYTIGGANKQVHEEAIKWYTEAAKLGHVKSELQLGRFYFEGLGTDVNYDQAARWLINPASKGYNKAQYMLGMIYLKGTDKIKKDNKKALTWLKLAADDFNIDAVYQVGKMYYYGTGTNKNNEQAKKYLKIAAEQEIEAAIQLLAQVNNDNFNPDASSMAISQKTTGELLIDKADAGDANSQIQLANAYLNGAGGIRQDTDQALKWMKRAARQGHTEAQYKLGSIYYNGKLAERNLDKATYWLNKAADNGAENAKVLISAIEASEQKRNARKKAKTQESTGDLFLSAANNGDKEAQYKVGLMYLYGEDGFPRDAEQALHWLKAAADQNHVEAQFHTGMAYYDPNSDSNSEAQNWLAKAAEAGHTDAQYFLGTIYNKQQRYDSAVHWLDVAFRNNHDEALDLLVDLYIGKKLANPDKARVLQWLEKASLNGFRDAQYELGEQYLINDDVANNKKKGFAWIQKAAKKGHVVAKYRLAVLYQEGIGVPKQYTKSSRWFREAAEEGHAEAQFELAELYRQGLGLPKSARKSRKWYEAAAEQGHLKAKIQLGSGTRF